MASLQNLQLCQDFLLLTNPQIACCFVSLIVCLFWCFLKWLEFKFLPQTNSSLTFHKQAPACPTWTHPQVSAFKTFRQMEVVKHIRSYAVCYSLVHNDLPQTSSPSAVSEWVLLKILIQKVFLHVYVGSLLLNSQQWWLWYGRKVGVENHCQMLWRRRESGG